MPSQYNSNSTWPLSTGSPSFGVGDFVICWPYMGNPSGGVPTHITNRDDLLAHSLHFLCGLSGSCYLATTPLGPRVFGSRWLKPRACKPLDFHLFGRVNYAIPAATGSLPLSKWLFEFGGNSCKTACCPTTHKAGRGSAQRHRAYAS